MMTVTQSPVLPALIAQLLDVATRARRRSSEVTMTRAERILLALHDRGNLPRTALSEAAQTQTRAADDAVAPLLDRGEVVTWTTMRGKRVARWYGLTDAGIARAKKLKEMEP